MMLKNNPQGEYVGYCPLANKPCLKEDCNLWDEVCQCCALLAIAKNLKWIDVELCAILKIMEDA